MRKFQGPAMKMAKRRAESFSIQISMNSSSAFPNPTKIGTSPGPLTIVSKMRSSASIKFIETVRSHCQASSSNSQPV